MNGQLILNNDLKNTSIYFDGSVSVGNANNIFQSVREERNVSSQIINYIEIIWNTKLTIK